MKIETYEQVVELVRSNALFDDLSTGSYYSGDETTTRTREAQWICLEFVLNMQGVHAILAEEYGTEDDQMILEWLRDAVLEQHTA